MARLLAIEWDAREARVAVAVRRGKDAVIEQAFAIDLTPGKEGGEVNVGERLKEVLVARGLGKVETLVAVGRANIELRVLNVPPAPEEELPDLVRFQAMRQFASIGEDWPLDFVPLEKASDGGQSVLAAAISPDLVAQIKATCEAATLEPQRLVLRPFAAASLLRRRTPDKRCRLMVDALSEEADLTVLADGNVVFLRTVRLPAHDSGEAWRPLLFEIRRTIAAAQSQLGNQRVEVVTLCGDEHDHRDLKNAVAQQLSLEVESFNPFAGPSGKGAAKGPDELPLSMSGSLSLTKAALAAFPENPGRFAPLLGLLAVEAAGERHAVDFLHPRKRPPPPSKRRPLIIAGAGAAAVVLVGGLLLFWSLSSLDADIEALRRTSASLNEKVKIAEAIQEDVEKIDAFAAGDVTWLDRLAKLSREIPPAEDVVFTQITLSVPQGGGGQATLDAAARQSSTIERIERELRERGNRISGTPGQIDPRESDYKWKFSETIRVLPEDEEPESAAAGEKPAAKPLAGNAAATGTTRTTPTKAPPAAPAARPSAGKEGGR